MTDDELSLKKRVARHRECNPDASAVAIAGALGADPAAVAEVLDEDGPDHPGVSSEDTGDRLSGSGRRPQPDLDGRWSTDAFATPVSEVYPPGQWERQQWMSRSGKQPFAPWGDRDPPVKCSSDDCPAERADDPQCDCDGRFKWGYDGHYRDGETAAMAEVDPQVDGLAFIQLPDDPYVYVDGDDVRDPETGDVHPAFLAVLEHLGLTYADISISGAGVHAIYCGELPDGVKQASWQLDEDPWGSNDDLPSIEVYPGKRVLVMTGKHIPGTPTEVQGWNDDVLDALLEANDEVATSQRDRADEDVDVSTERGDYNLNDYQPSTTSSSETTTDIRDIFAAIDRLDARHVAEKTIVHRWNDDASTSDGERAFAPTWGPNSNGTANIVNSERWMDTGDLGGYGGPVTMAAIDAGEVRPSNASPVDGETWWRGIEHLRKLGFDIPEFEHPESDSRSDENRHPLLDQAIANDADVDAAATSTLPLGQLEALNVDDRRRAARKRGLDWPSTEEARERLLATIKQAMRHEDETVIDAPTSLGKSFAVATTRWDVFDDVTGEKPVIHLSATRDARDEAAQAAREHGGEHKVLLSRHEACPVAAGDHDPREVADCDDEDRQVITIDGEPASSWLDRQCDAKGLPFSAAHQFLADHNDQGVDLPCGGEGCGGITQWDDWREGEYPLAIVTHNFAHVPGLRTATNVVVDEQPDFTMDLSKDRVERAITAYLQEIDAPVQTWEAFISLVAYDGWGDDAAKERDQLRTCLDAEPDREWYLQESDAHTLAPALARAIFHAEDRGNGRRVGKTPHEPPRLDANAGDGDAWNRVWVTVVLDEDNDVRTVRSAPDLSQARSVIGLDAHPARPVWAVNTVPHINTTEVLGREERQLWRRFERGLRVVQVGEATRPLASGEYFQPDQVRALAEHLRAEYGAAFRTAISTKAVEGQLESLLEDAGVRDPETMHYGEEKSRNDFAGERAGLVEGCIDPGDGMVLDLLAELDCEAAPETVAVDGAEERAHGRGFEGPDADVATEVLASVRENHTAQAAGRYARDPENPDSHATVFVRTDAMPPGFADVQVNGVEWVFSDLQETIVDELREATGRLSAREVADRAGCSKAHARETLARLADQGAVQALEGVGEHGATIYADDGCPHSGVVDLESSADSIANGSVQGSCTWALAIRDPTPPDEVSSTDDYSDDTRDTTVWDWRTAGDPC